MTPLFLSGRTLRKTLLLPFVLVCLITDPAFGQHRPLITTQVDESKLAQLRGNISGQLKEATDLGNADVSQPAGRMLLVLKRSPEQESELQAFLQQSHQPTSPNFHKWLTPDVFGKRFGAHDSDIQQLTRWLQSHGLNVAKLSASKNVIEFSGTVGQVQGAFHTAIHTYNVHGEVHHANATEPQIPDALRSVVSNVSQLNDFRPKSYAQLLGTTIYNPKNHQGQPKPDWNIPPGAQVAAPFYFLAPEDVATQYDIAPVYAAGVTGTGQTIGIINDSNIDISLVNSYRKLFHLSYNPPEVIVDGEDPGINGDAVEAYLDVENAGAVAPDSKVKLYTSSNFGLLGDGGLSYAILRAVNDDAAPVLSLSFGACETFAGSGFNTYINSIWEEAAAQGQTVLVSTGDHGPEDECVGLGVSTFASSPWVVGVGGTDIYLSDYASGGASLAGYWADSNDANLGSLQKHFTEQPWDGTQFGLNDITYDSVARQPRNRGASGGGASSCAQSTYDAATSIITCVSGWPKPSWQTGIGVPDDGVRDLPDLSLFASGGYNGVAWPICAFPGDCTENNPYSGSLFVTGVGGTSASAPAMAGIMALINQKYGPQGQANFVLYPLAAQFPAVFNPVTLGSNNITCAANSYECSPDTTDGFDSYQLYPATAGYDLASGLGTVDVNQMLTNWPNITFAASQTSLLLTPTTITHGDNVTVTATVTGHGTPTGAVSLLSSTTLPSNKSVDFIRLGAGGTGSGFVPNLPGGTYTITGQYGGDGVNAPSTSDPITVTVSAENSMLAFTPQAVDPATYLPASIKPGEQVPFNSGIALDVQINGATGQFDGVPTGTITFTDGGTTLAVLPVSSAGTVQFDANSLPPGSHTIGASYSGDASYKPSSIAPFTFLITKAPLTGYVVADFNATYNDDGSVEYLAGQSAAISAYYQWYSSSGGACPTGSVTAQLGNSTPVILKIVPCLSIYAGFDSSTTDVLTNLQVGTQTLTFNYPGDANYGPFTISQIITVKPSTLLPSKATLTFTPSNITSSSLFTATVTVTGNGTITPTGKVIFSLQNYEYFPADGITLTPAGNGTATATFTDLEDLVSNGPNEFFALYYGDGNYLSSATPVTAMLSDTTAFTMTATTPTVVVKSGSSGSASVALTSMNQFSGAVTLTCSAPASLICTLPAAAPVLTPNGNITGTVTINTAVPADTAGIANQPSTSKGFAVPALACALVLLVPKRRRFGKVLLALFFCAALGTGIGCSGKSTPNAPVSPTAPAPVLVNAKPGSYDVVITATIPNGLTHNASITVVVQ